MSVYGQHFAPHFIELENTGQGERKSKDGASPNEASKETDLRIYPNLAASYITLSTKNIDRAYTVCIYSLDGKQVLERNINGIQVEEYRMDISGLTDGLYIVNLSEVGDSKLNSRFEIIRQT